MEGKLENTNLVMKTLDQRKQSLSHATASGRVSSCSSGGQVCVPTPLSELVAGEAFLYTAPVPLSKKRSSFLSFHNLFRKEETLLIGLYPIRPQGKSLIENTVNAIGISLTCVFLVFFCEHGCSQPKYPISQSIGIQQTR